MKKIRFDFIIILLLIAAAPLAFFSKNIFTKDSVSGPKKYSIHISMDETIKNLNDYNFKEHYSIAKRSVDKGERLGNFAACFVFNRYRDDLLLYRNDLFTDPSLSRKSDEKNNLINWCLSSYKYMDDNVDSQYRAAYYKAVGYNYLYGFKGMQDIDKAQSFFTLAHNTFKTPESLKAVNIIQKYKNMYPGLKSEYLLIYIDNELKNK